MAEVSEPAQVITVEIGRGGLKGADPKAEQSPVTTGSVKRDMATIRASCPDCGDVELTTDDVKVRVCLDDDRGEYRFTCPICTMVVVKPAEHRTIDLLVASGVHMDTWTLPAELFETRTGRRISHDDILDFHRLLADEDAIAEALASISER